MGEREKQKRENGGEEGSGGVEMADASAFYFSLL